MSELETAPAATRRRGVPILLVRWVHPESSQITILADESALLGRDRTCTTQLDSHLVSRRHAALSFSAGGHEIEDLGSKNGVFVDGWRVRHAPVLAGSVLRIGDFVGVVESVPLSELVGFRDFGWGTFGGAATARALVAAQELSLRARELLLVGESGTGKKRLARTLHRWRKAIGPLVALDCRAPEHELANELDRVQAGGTLLLEDPGLLATGAQQRVLAALDGAAFQLIATCRQDLAQLQQRLVPELRTRLSASAVLLPPLRERRSEIVPLFRLALERHALKVPPTLDPELVERLCLYTWPLNLQELNDVAERLLSRHATEPELQLGHLLSLEYQQRPPQAGVARPSPARRSTPPYSSGEVEGLSSALERHRGNLSRAAAELGITRSKAYRMLSGVRLRH